MLNLKLQVLIKVWPIELKTIGQNIWPNLKTDGFFKKNISLTWNQKVFHFIKNLDPDLIVLQRNHESTNNGSLDKHYV
jgi:hypothetical protein